MHRFNVVCLLRYPGSVTILNSPGLDVMKLEYSLKLTSSKQPIVTLYFEFENELKFYNLESWLSAKNTETVVCQILICS